VTFLSKKKKRKVKTERNKQGKRPQRHRNHTTVTTSADEDEGVVSVVWGRWMRSSRGGGWRGRTTETNMAVSFTVYSSTPETWYKAIEFCLLGLSFHSSHRSGV
jgi:hypothetical protein